MESRRLGKFYLASASPRRQSLLTELGIPYQLQIGSSPEPAHPSTINNIKDLSIVIDIAAHKAEAGYSEISGPKSEWGLVLGADTLVFLGETVFGKPRGPEEARSMLQQLSGVSHTVATGVHLIRFEAEEIAETESCMVTTNVTFRSLDPYEIDWYVGTGEPLDKAGAYGAQGIGASLIERIEGSYTNVVGLPLSETTSLISRLSGFPWQTWTQK